MRPTTLNELRATEQKVLTFVVRSAFTTNRAVPQHNAHLHIEDDALPVLRRLEEQGLLRKLNSGACLPTARAELMFEDLAADTRNILEVVLKEGRRTFQGSINYVAFADLLRSVCGTTGSPDGLPHQRFHLSTVVGGLGDLIYGVHENEDGEPEGVFFSPKVLSMKTVDDIYDELDGRRGPRPPALEWVIETPKRTPPAKRNADDSSLRARIRDLAIEVSFEETLRAILMRDAQEVEDCRSVRAYKAVCLLCGSILEAVLVSLLQLRSDLAEPALRRLHKKKKFPDDASLTDLIALATSNIHPTCEPLLQQKHEVLREMVDHRDLIHPHAEVRGGRHPVGDAAADLMYAELKLVLDELMKAVKSGWVKRYMS